LDKLKREETQDPGEDLKERQELKDNGVTSRSLDAFVHFSDRIAQQAEESDNSVQFVSSPKPSQESEDPHLAIKRIKANYERLTQQLKDMGRDQLNYFQHEFEDMREEPQEPEPVSMSEMPSQQFVML
jgi:hypothetical protein